MSCSKISLMKSNGLDRRLNVDWSNRWTHSCLNYTKQCGNIVPMICFFIESKGARKFKRMLKQYKNGITHPDSKCSRIMIKQAMWTIKPFFSLFWRTITIPLSDMAKLQTRYTLGSCVKQGKNACLRWTKIPANLNSTRTINPWLSSWMKRLLVTTNVIWSGEWQN